VLAGSGRAAEGAARRLSTPIPASNTSAVTDATSATPPITNGARDRRTGDVFGYNARSPVALRMVVLADLAAGGGSSSVAPA